MASRNDKVSKKNQAEGKNARGEEIKRIQTKLALLNNTNAEKWTLPEAFSRYEKALELAQDPQYDYIGELNVILDVNKDFWSNMNAKFPELKPIYDRIKERLLVNCYANIKSKKSHPAVGIFNLKVNHNWKETSVVENQHTITGPIDISDLVGFRDDEDTEG